MEFVGCNIENAESLAQNDLPVEGSTEGTYAFKVLPSGSDEYVTPVGFINVGSEDIVLEEPVVIPLFANEGDIVDGVFDAGNGLEIDVVASSFISSYGVDDYIAAVDVDPTTAGLPL